MQVKWYKHTIIWYHNQSISKINKNEIIQRLSNKKIKKQLTLKILSINTLNTYIIKTKNKNYVHYNQLTINTVVMYFYESFLKSFGNL